MYKDCRRLMDEWREFDASWVYKFAWALGWCTLDELDDLLYELVTGYKYDFSLEEIYGHPMEEE